MRVIEHAFNVIKSGTFAVFPLKNTIPPQWNQRFIPSAYYALIYTNLCILCNSSFMGVYTLTGHFWLASANFRKACACCTIPESGASCEKSEWSALNTVKKCRHSAQIGGCVFVHVAQWLFEFLYICLNNFLIPHLTPSNCKHISFKPQHIASYIQEIAIYCIFSERSDRKF